MAKTAKMTAATCNPVFCEFISNIFTFADCFARKNARGVLQPELNLISLGNRAPAFAQPSCLQKDANRGKPDEQHRAANRRKRDGALNEIGSDD